MPIPTRETLKAFLETGDVPTQAQFGQIIDAMYDMAQQAQDTADAAEAAVAAALPLVAKVYGAFTLTTGLGAAVTPIHLEGCSIGLAYFFASLNTHCTVTITFDAAFPDANYVLTLQSYKTADGSPVTFTRTRAAGTIVMAAVVPTGTTIEFHFTIHRTT